MQEEVKAVVVKRVTVVERLRDGSKVVEGTTSEKRARWLVLNLLKLDPERVFEIREA